MRLSLDPQDPNSVRFPRERGQHGDENFAGDTLSGLFDVTGGDLMDVHLEDHVGQPGAALYYRAMNILTMVLLIVSVGGVVRLDTRSAMIAVVLSAFFALIYSLIVLGQYTRLWQILLFLGALTLVWVLMLPIVPVSVYMVFPLFFLYLRVLPDIRGIIAVVGATIIAIFSQMPDLTLGAVMGPLVSALVVIAIHFAFEAIWKGARERDLLIQELISTRSQLAETERAAGVAAERQRIAHEIHDTLAQGLSSIQMLLRVSEQDIKNSSMSEEEQAVPLKRMELARTTAADNLSEARAMIAALQPAALSKTSLEGALHRVAEQIVSPEISILVEGVERQLPMRTEAALLRIGQGALGNVAKHSQAERCQVTLTYADDEVRLDVVDNGQGFDPEQVANRPAGLGHIGINAMRQRAEEQGGTLEVESAPGDGTAVSVALPIRTES
ncbi:sensor histidine kinase [Corynebacterium ulcerans]|uniref:Oxygen sensor histidine kinase NreB n=2 Tax=Corynebacterium ulcerans TaxID=65058 RepID=A0ABD7MV48_CORUL|nr:sensor histidine kinase [Corynebacterium ulcerans]AKN78095.1 Two-component system sensor kinase protein [Corynebacterium ulcerans FRC58]KPH74171.1 ATPase [Corynebacterium ulcerans]MBH5296228.1 sensor histidine kinase [Corynebacterium ulcerans]MBH5302428.1 sensor histidine kinase [Corynebacterium ulcerans]MBL4944945.1 sensor histidine kinase [Corynebacterium ulcerans]